MIWSGRRRIPLAHPFFHPSAIVRDLTSTVFPAADKVRLAAWAISISRQPWLSAANVANETPVNRSAIQLLRDRGFSDAFIDRFARPFWGGILLDRSLSASAGVLEFTLRMFISGSGVLPREGLGAVPAAIAADLPDGAIQTGARVAALHWEAGAVTGVEVADGGRIAASAVVVATDPPAAAALTGIGTIPTDPVGCVTVFLSGQTDPGVGKRLVLDGTGTRSVNHIAPLSTVQPAYAPAGSHLIAAVMLGEDALAASDDDLSRRALADVGLMLGQPNTWYVRRIVRVPFALYRQDPGLHRRLPDAATGTRGLFLASDATVDASVNGALFSGESSARAVQAARYA
jgi:phytoene dehydrogenase-like protein